jgi:GntR family transcriptional regulator, transcriptional repressor for pyruvate dehydrogenase complex
LQKGGRAFIVLSDNGAMMAPTPPTRQPVRASDFDHDKPTAAAPGAGVRGDQNLTDRVASLLREEITGGQFKPGDVLAPEQVIAERLGVSRTVVREAVSRLKVDGFVASRQGRGLTVLNNRKSSVLRLPAFSGKDVDEVLAMVELRLGFDIEAAGFAALRRRPADLEAMEVALGDMGTALRNGDVPAGTEADFRFHRAIAHAAHNPNYLTFFDFLGDLYQRNLLVSRGSSARADRAAHAQREHAAIFEAIRAGDADRARGAVRVHVENTGSRLRTLDARPPRRA